MVTISSHCCERFFVHGSFHMWSWKVIVVLHFSRTWLIYLLRSPIDSSKGNHWSWNLPKHLLCEICLWPRSSLPLMPPVECILGARTWAGPCRTWDARVAMTWRSKVTLPASWDGHVDALEKHVFLHNFCMVSSNSVFFSDTFSQMVGDT